MWRFHWLKGGSDALLPKLAANTALVEEQFATKYHLSKGRASRPSARPACGSVSR